MEKEAFDKILPKINWQVKMPEGVNLDTIGETESLVSFLPKLPKKSYDDPFVELFGSRPAGGEPGADTSVLDTSEYVEEEEF
jgi:hypothetical protein